MGTPIQTPPARRHFIIEIWDENREAFKAILTDTFWCLIGLGVLFVLFLFAHGMDQRGYPHEFIQIIETFHFWVYLVVLVMFGVDLVMKLFTFLFLKRKP